jgi:predicted RNA-binding Zn-ribbon protein involved in translation (DUF1610 family)
MSTQDPEKLAEGQKKLVEAGGVYFRCLDCDATGVYRPENPVAVHARETMRIPAPRLAGITFTKKNCPHCGPKAVRA